MLGVVVATRLSLSHGLQVDKGDNVQPEVLGQQQAGFSVSRHTDQR